MKAIKMRMQKFSRPGVILLATVVAIITSIVVANATQTITAPNAAFITYNLLAGQSSAAITPATNRSVLVMGCCNFFGGVGQVSLLHGSSGSHFITWVGLESQSAAATNGSANAGGIHIVWIDSSHLVDIETASADTILIHNSISSGITLAGNVTLVW